MSMSPKPIRPIFKQSLIETEDGELLVPASKQKTTFGSRKNSGKITSTDKHRKTKSRPFDINVGEGLKVSNNQEFSAELPLNINLNTNPENLEQTSVINMPKFEKSSNKDDLTKLQQYLKSRSTNNE